MYFRLLLLILSLFVSKQNTYAQGELFQLRYFDLVQGRLAFSYSEGDIKDIYVLDFRDLSFLPFANSSLAEESPSWSPDGQTLVFHAETDKGKEIYSIEADGTNLKQLTNNTYADEDPSFSPDGKSIIFQSRRREKSSEIFSMDLDGKQQKQISFPPESNKLSRRVTPKYTPDGGAILMVTDSQWPGWDIALLKGKEKIPFSLSKGLASFIRPAPKPDSSSFVFSYGNANEFDLYSIARGESNPTLLIQRPGRELDPCWNETGMTLFFVAETEPGKSDFQLFAHDLQQNKTSLVFSSKGSIRHPSWTPYPSLAQLESQIKIKASSPPSTQ